MVELCGRCKQEEAKFECADCVSSKRRGELLLLCDSCHTLIHVGFLDDHQVISLQIREKKTEFEDHLTKFKSQEKYMLLKLNEVNFAKQDIEQRSQYNQQVVSQAFLAVRQALKDKEKDLTTSLRDDSKEKMALLAECENSMNKTSSEFKILCSDADKLLKGSSIEFSQRYEQTQKQLSGFEVGNFGTSFSTLLSSPAHLDVSSLLEGVKGLHLQDGDEVRPNEDEAAAREEENKQRETLPELQTLKQGDTVQVYAESRLDGKSRFWASRNLSQDVANIYENLSFRIREDIVQSPLAQVDIVEGMLCCGQFQEDRRWYRGRVEHINKDKGFSRVRWLDYAHCNDIPIASVQPLKDKFQTLPFQALECCLFDDLLEDLPHPARWEFSDHSANALLDCTIIREISSCDNSPLYLIELKNTYKGVNIKDKVLEKAGEAKCKRDTIVCRDIRYMKDYTPPPANNQTPSSKKGSPEPSSSKKGSSPGPSSSKEDSPEPSSSKKGSPGPSSLKEDSLESSSSKKGSTGPSNLPEPSSTKEESQDRPQAAGPEKESSDEVNMHSNEKSKEVEDEEDGGGSSMQAKTSQDTQKTVTTEEATAEASMESAAVPSEDGVVDDKEAERDKEEEVQRADRIEEKHQNGDVAVDPPMESTPAAATSLDDAGGSDSEKRRADEISSHLNAEAASFGGVVAASDAENGAVDDAPRDPKDDAQGVDSAPPKVATDGSDRKVDAGVYSLEPDADDDDDGLTERLARQGDRAMAHSPDHDPTYLSSSAAGSDQALTSKMYSVKDGVYVRGPQDSRGNGPSGYQDAGGYGNRGYTMGMGGMQQQQQQYAPTALGLHPMPSSMGGYADTYRSDRSSHTGDGVKIAVGSTFGLCVATPLLDNGHFWATKMRGPFQESQLRRLMHDISMPFEPLTIDKLKEIKVVCAQSASGQWCRAKVEGINNKMVNIRYVDFGQADIVEEHRIKVLPVSFQLFPYQAIELSIATANHTHFTEHAKEAFMKYTQGRTLTAKVVSTTSKIVAVTLSCVDENQLRYDISSAVLKINAESAPPGNTDERKKSAENCHRSSHEEQQSTVVHDDSRSGNPYSSQYDIQHSGGRSHDRQYDRGSGDRCYICNIPGHFSYDCPNKRGDDRNYKNRGGGNKKGWGRKSRKY